MSSFIASTDYVLGNNAAEHARLTRQASMVAPSTERLFRGAGIAAGQRVLDVGSGVGDVALLTAAIVGRSGSVVGIDRDSIALTKARARAAAIGASQIQFVEGDISEFRCGGDFDAVVGRFILMYMPDPSAIVRSLGRLLRPGGVIVFQEPSWASFFACARHLPLRTACGELVCDTFRRAGAEPDMPLTLFQALLDGGFPTPNINLETLMAFDAAGRRWISELIVSLRPRFTDLGVGTGPVGDLDTLDDRLEREVVQSRSYVPMTGLVGAWSWKPRPRAE